MPGVNSASLVWNHATLSEDGNILARIFLFSHCINPTNTSLTPSLGTLLYSSDRSHLTSSTTIPQPANSACSYFGCYEGCFGLCIYTFSEVSCTAHSVVTTDLDMRLSSTVQQSTAVFSSLPILQTTNPVLSTTMLRMQSPTTEAVSSLPTLQTSQAQDQVEQSSITKPPEATPSLLPFETPTLAVNGISISIWSWFIPLLVTVLLTTTAAMVSVIVARSCCRSRQRNMLRNMKGISWHTDPWTGCSASPSIDFKKPDTLSLHSVHTLYDELNSTPTDKSEVARVELPAICSGDEFKEGLTVSPATDASDGKNKCDSGLGTCNSGTGTYDNSSRNTDSGTMSYVTYGSLFWELQWKENDSYRGSA